MYAINHVPALDMSRATTGCCALIEPAQWDKQVIKFDDKPFAVTRTRSFFHMPLNMGSVMKKTLAKIEDSGAGAEEFLTLSYEASPWHADHYFAVNKEVPGLKLEKLSGMFLTKVFEGPFRDAGKWYKQLIEFAKSEGKQPIKTYFYYTVCPNCAKVYGKNYVVGFEQIK